MLMRIPTASTVTDKCEGNGYSYIGEENNINLEKFGNRWRREKIDHSSHTLLIGMLMTNIG